MLLMPIPWASRVWVLLFLSTLAPSERYAAERGRSRHKKITDWARQLLLQVRHRYPEREIVAVVASTYASQAAFSLPKLEQTGDLHHAVTLGCCALRASSSASPRPDRKASPQGRALARSFG